jgi:hypothetical protein
MNRQEQMTHEAIQASAKELGRVANAIEKLVTTNARVTEALPGVKEEKTNLYDDLGLDVKFPYPDENLDGIKRLIADIYYVIGEFESETSKEDHNIIAGLKHLLELIAKGEL